MFVDATIFIYHFTGVSLDCRKFLERAERGEIAGIVSALVLAEISHRLMMIEAVSRGFVESPNVATKLREKPAIVKKLGSYQDQLDRIPLMGIEVRPVDLAVFHRSKGGRAALGLLTNDSLVLASSEEAEVDALATADRDFRRVRNIDVYFPGDLR